MAPNFTDCGIRIRNAASQTPNPYAHWAYHGPIRGVIQESERPTLITLEGCLTVCGSGFQTYDWSKAANTITTWVLPIVGGLLLQAPFESNRFWRTFFAFIRWMGSPISSLSYVLWNIKVTGKCALMVDMAGPFDEIDVNEDSEFHQMRDAFYILAVMNQYEIKSRMPEKEAEKLLRIALFSNSLRLEHDGDAGQQSLPELRKALAYDLRRGRRRGVVPVFIATGWFLFSLGISIESAFGELGENATAHNLGLGLMLGWIPVFVLGSIIDRNPLSSDDVRLRLNDLLDRVRRALLDRDLRDTYIRDTGQASDDYRWTRALDNDDFFSASFFTDFAGQGRSRWHYGVAHPILAGIEKAYVAGYGRDWLRDSERARTAMVIGPEVLTGLRWFDWREIWQISSAATVVVGTITGATIISYWTPTVGLGCRSGGYMVFIVIALASLVIEMLLWWWATTESATAPVWLRRATFGDPLMHVGGRLERRLSRAQPHTWQTSLRWKIQNWMSVWESLQFRSKIDIVVLKPLDLINTAWLVYIVNAQTFGWYRECRCMSSVWASGGGYIDFETIDFYKAYGISIYWGSGTALSLVILCIAISFIIAEWCSQGHLSTMDRDAAGRGLRRTRLWKYYTVWLRRAPNAIIQGALLAYWGIFGLVTGGGGTRQGRKSLIWSAEVRSRHLPFGSVIHRAPVSTGGDDEEMDLLNAGRPYNDDSSTYRLDVPSPSHTRISPTGSSVGLHWGPEINPFERVNTADSWTSDHGRR